MLDELARAIRNGNAGEVRRLIQQVPNVNGKISHNLDHGPYIEGVTPLMIAAAAPKSTTEIVKILLDAGADPKEKSDGGVTATWYAAGGGTGYPLTEDYLKELDADHPFHNWGGGDVERLRLLLDAGGNPNEAADNGRSLISESCQLGDPERVKLLIERNASVWPAKDRTQKSFRLPAAQEVAYQLLTGSKFSFIPVPLFEAAKSGSAECVRLILATGFPADYKHDKKTALDFASNAEVTNIFLQAGLQNQPGQFGFDAIDNAFQGEYYDVARKLLEAIPHKDRDRVLNEKLILSAGLRMDPTAVKMLIEMGADPKRPDPDYGSALHSACWQGDGNGGRENSVVEETLEILISAGADLEMWDRHGNTPLLEAVEGDWSSPTSVRVLVKHGAKVNVTDKQGRTPLMIAAGAGSLPCVETLLDAGADRTLQDLSGKTALDHARGSFAYWQSPSAKLPFMARLFNKMLGVDFNLDKSKEADKAAAIVKLLES